jgi:diguanylate cyclase (GGDEF)-like protein
MDGPEPNAYRAKGSVIPIQNGKQFKVLVVEEGLKCFPLLQNPTFKPVGVERLEEALALLGRGESGAGRAFDLILLDLALPDGQGLDAFFQVYSQAPDVPIVVLNGGDPNLALAVIREGAQDCLFWEEIDGPRLQRALLFASERQRTRALLQHLCLTDDLTELLNRRGFYTMALQQVKIARRENWKLLLMFADLDGLKKINDSFGHPEGDQALRFVAGILRETFRTSDLIARLGGDEFMILAANVAPNGAEPITQRLQESIDRFNASLPAYQISLSWGVAFFDPLIQDSLDEVIAQADQALYQHKRAKLNHH